MDQAVYANSVKAGGGYVFAVRSGYVFRFKQDGTLDAFARYAFGWGDASIAYDSDNDRIFCSFWNELRADDAGVIEGASLVRGLYRIDPGTLAVDGFLQMNTDAPPLLDTGAFTGPRQILYYANYIWLHGLQRAGFGGATSYLHKIDPVAMTILATAAGYGTGASQYIDIAIDANSGLLWESAGEVQKLASTDLATFLVQANVDLNPIVTAAGAGIVSNMTVDLSINTVQNFPGGPFPSGYYLIEYVNGVLATFNGYQQKYFVMDPHGLATCPSFTPGFMIYQDNSSVYAANGSQFLSDTQTDAHNEGLAHITSMDYYVPGGGGTWNIGLKVPISPNIVTPPTIDSCPDFWLEEDFEFNLNQVLTYPVAATLKFTPYGICHVPDVDAIYAATRTSSLICYRKSSGSVLQVASGDPTCFAYRVRYNPYDAMIYVPGYKSNRITVINPMTNAVVATYNSIESCFDVCFSPTGSKWAVCHSPSGIVPF